MLGLGLGDIKGTRGGSIAPLPSAISAKLSATIVPELSYSPNLVKHIIATPI